MLATLTIEPGAPRPTRCRTTAFATLRYPLALTSKVLSNAASSAVIIGPKCGLVAALLTRTSIFPKRSTTASTSAST